jgi:hypothetical protein
MEKEEVESIEEIRIEVEKFNDYENQVMTLGMVNEFITLYIDGREITSGEYEVLQRVKEINRERGLEFF